MKVMLNKKVGMDLSTLIDSRLLIQANSGGGKSFAIRRLIEQTFGRVQIIVIDPEGEFGNMRSAFDFVYVGKGGDAPAEPRSAALLAHRLLELNASAIIDLYEIPKQRKEFVRLFCDAMVNAPKELWHDTLIIIDEAHVFAPEKGESEALGAVVDLATRGRKRGYCVVLATQRLSKLNKDAAAECNNKLIGRASQDIDRKRAGEELGFTSREEIISLRNLRPGEFYAFGPAISEDVQKIEIGAVEVKPAKRGVTKTGVPAPTAAVKKILARLADLPQEAVEEAKTVSELKAALALSQHALKVEKQRKVDLGKEIIDLDYTTKSVAHALAERDMQWAKLIDKWEDSHVDLINFICLIEQMANKMYAKRGERPPYTLDAPDSKPIVLRGSKQTYADVFPAAPLGMPETDTEKVMGQGERAVLASLASHGTDGMTRDHVTVATGYKKSTRDAYIKRLMGKGYVEVANGKVYATGVGAKSLGDYFLPLPTGIELFMHYMQTLPEGEKRVLAAVKEGNTNREDITNATGYKKSTRDAYIKRLSTRQLVKTAPGGVVEISEHLL